MKRNLFEVAWEITDECNFNCIHCYNPKHRQDLESAFVYAVLDEFKALGVRQIKYGGGEPLLRKDFLDILERTIDLGFVTNFSTNGYIVNPEVVSRLKDMGLEKVQVSLDGNEKIHNYVRNNPNAYGKAIDAVKLFVGAGLKVSVATTLLKSNLNCLEDIFDACTASGVNRWRVMKYIPVNRKDLMPSPQEYHASQLKLEELEKKSKGLDVFIMKEFDAVRRPKFRDAHDAICSGGRTMLSVKANGDVSPCSYFPFYIAGNLRYESVEKIWKSGKMLEFSKEFYGHKTCKHFNLCQGGCKAATYYARKDQGCDPYCLINCKNRK